MRTSTYPFQELSTPQLPEELWRDIPGSEGHYQISNKGRARRLAHELINKLGVRLPLATAILCQQVKQKPTAVITSQTRGHLNFSITVAGDRKQVNTARMVYYCFVQAFDLTRKDLVVLYRDDDPLNVLPENLYLGTLKDKAKLAAQRPQANPVDYSVSQYTLDGKLVRTYTSSAQAASVLGLSTSSIRAAINKRDRITAGGYAWRKGSASTINLQRGKSAQSFETHERFLRKISQYNFDGILVRTFASINEASRDTGTDRSTLQRALAGDYISAGNYIWAYGDALRIDLRAYKQRPHFEKSALGQHLLHKRIKNLEKMAERKALPTTSNEFDKGKLHVAQNLLLEFDFTDEQAAQATELPMDQIQLLREQLSGHTGSSLAVSE